MSAVLKCDGSTGVLVQKQVRRAQQARLGKTLGLGFKDEGLGLRVLVA